MVSAKTHYSIVFVLMVSLCQSLLPAQEREESRRPQTQVDLVLVSKYLWRGQRLTDDFSLQTSLGWSLAGFQVGLWGNLDLAAVNEGDALLLAENPASSGRGRGLKGKFSEVDLTFSYSRTWKSILVEGGSILYLFPERSASLPSTWELFGGFSLPEAPLSPGATVYVDLDETREGGSSGLYLQLTAGQEIPLVRGPLRALAWEATWSFANSSFGRYYYGLSRGGLHDVALTLILPLRAGEKWEVEGFLTFGSLRGPFRQHQLRDLREVYRGTAGPPSDYADTFLGGVRLGWSF